MQLTKRLCRAWRRRALPLAMALVLMLGLLPVFPAEEVSAHWADPYLGQLVEWGFIRADQANNPDLALTRADFMAIVNRAYGYHETGETPFEDVSEPDWFYDDVGIAYTARYIKGTSPTTASPKAPLTRETATTILGRNMMLEESPGELVDFTDAHQISTWASGTIKSSLEHYLVSGYNDGTFRPQRNVSWGEMASMLSSLVGTPLQEPGDYSLGGVYGNVTITSSDVTLRDTVIAGDLYISGGVGLGGIVLENVTVLGRIVACGTGQSEGGQASILLRNVTADEMLVDNLQDHYVSIRADGVTEIGKTTVRTSAYIEDNTPDGLGLHYISLEGESYPEGEEPEDWVPIQLDLAGRIEEVVNRTPRSQVHVGAGTVAKLTVDEAAEGSNVIIDRGAVVKELNLDTATTVTGKGDVEHLVVNAPGCDVEMLPDEIDIRPGITAKVNGEEMDTVGAKESSEQPRILAGYPEAQDVIPTGLDAVFMTNKSGTVYWAVSALTDGSVGEEDLIKPPSYGSVAVAHGSVKVLKGNEETISKVTGLTPGGSYYLSAVLVDARGQRSTVKVISFTTPDNTIPEFCAGYPKMSSTARTDSVVVVMPNKDCKLYYALLPEGAKAPTEDELKTSSVSGALGYGVRDVRKNVEDAFRVNDVILDEQTTYVLYLWLVDADGVNKGKIVSLKFTTADETPPEFIVDPTPNKIQATSVSLTFRLNEDGVVFWVAVPAGTLYPKPEPGTSYETAPLDSDYAKLQVASGMNLGSDGKFGKVNAKMNADGTITVSGLSPDITSYDFYYLAQDKAGNYSVFVKKITINVLDNTSPVITQSFELTSDPNDNTRKPTSDSDIYLDISENVLYLGKNGGTSFRELYNSARSSTGAAQTAAINLWALNLYNAIRLHKVNGNVAEIYQRGTDYAEKIRENDFTIDYTQAYITDNPNNSNGIRIVFPSEGLNLESGARYYFTVTGLYDTSNNQNQIKPDPIDFTIPARRTEAIKNGHSLEPFDVAPPSVWFFTTPGVGAGEGPTDRNADGTLVTKKGDDGTETPVLESQDGYFRIEPRSTSSTSSSVSYDILMWSDLASTSYSLYYRVVDPDQNRKVIIGADGKYPDTYTYTDPNSGTAEPIDIENYLIRPNRSGGYGDLTVDKNGWIWLGTNTVRSMSSDGWWGQSLNKLFNNCDQTNFPLLKHLDDRLEYEFVISLETFKGSSNRDLWSGEVHFQFDVIAGQSSVLYQAAEQLAGGRSTLNSKFIEKGLLTNIGWWSDEAQETLELEWSRLAYGMPEFSNRTPTFSDITHESATLNVSLTSTGTVHYVVGQAKNSTGQPEIPTTRTVTEAERKAIEESDLPESVWVDGGHNEIYITFEDLPTGVAPPPKSGLEAMPKWMLGTPGNEWSESNTKDDPLGTNLITLPDFSRVGSYDDLWDTTEPVAHGSFSAGSTTATQEIIKGLEPSTDYYIYLVIDNDNGSQSHGYIYHFKTNPTMKPKINISPESDGSAWLATDNAATLQYVLFTLPEATDKTEEHLKKLSILKESFNKYIDGSNNTAPEFGVTGSIPSIWSDDSFTVLDALRTTYSYTNIPSSERTKEGVYIPRTADGSTTPYEGGYSVFDIYANSTLRQQILLLIDRDGIVINGATIVDYSQTGINTPGNNVAIQQALKDVDEGNQYVILTVAKNRPPRGDEVDKAPHEVNSFKAYSPIEKSAGAAPNLKNATLSLIVLDPDPTEAGKLPTFTGTLTLLFDKKLYTHVNGKNEILNSSNIKNNIKFQPSSVTGIEPTTTATTTEASDTITIEFTRLRAGQTLTLPGSPKVLYNASDAGADEALQVKMESETRTDGQYNTIWVRYIVTWGTQGTDPDYVQIETEWIEVARTLIPTDPAPAEPSPDAAQGANAAVATVSKPVTPTGLTFSNVSGAKLSGTSLKMTGTDLTSTIKATITPSGATGTITWASSNTKIATVAPSGTGNSQVKITGLTAGSTTITATVGNVKKSFTVIVSPSITVSSFTANSTASTLKLETDGTYTWTRKSGTSCAATMKFTTGLSLDNSTVTVTSSDTKAVSVGQVTKSGTTGQVQLTFGSMNKTGQVTVTVKVGTASQSFKIKLVGGDVSAVNIAAKK